MPRELDYTDKALADLEAIRRWLTQPGAGRVSQRKMAALWAAIDRLVQHPCLYPIGDHPGVRELPCPHGYRAYYEVHPDTGHNHTAGDVRLLRVFGPGQDRTTFDASS